MKTYETYEKVGDLKPCRKKPIIIHAKQINEEFNVNTLEGNYKMGKAGDYLMQGIEEELYICDKAIFEKTYDWVRGNGMRKGKHNIVQVKNPKTGHYVKIDKTEGKILSHKATSGAYKNIPIVGGKR